MINEEEHINIVSQDDSDCLIGRIVNGPMFAKSFHFKDLKMFIAMLGTLSIDYEEYIKNGYHYFDKARNLHISSSEFDYVWISTYGLVAKGKTTSNNFVNACMNQYVIITLLLDKAIEISDRDDVYDVDGFYFGYLSELTPALFHNILFYFELFGKAYLSLCEVEVPHIHKLTEIFTIIKETMRIKNHNDSLFQVFIITEFEKIVNHVSSIPGGFREQYVKYDDNAEDSTVVVFNSTVIKETKHVIDMSNDLIFNLYYDGKDPMYLMPGVLKRMLDKASTEMEKKNIIDMYGHLASDS